MRMKLLRLIATIVTAASVLGSAVLLVGSALGWLVSVDNYGGLASSFLYLSLALLAVSGLLYYVDPDVKNISIRRRFLGAGESIIVNPMWLKAGAIVLVGGFVGGGVIHSQVRQLPTTDDPEHVVLEKKHVQDNLRFDKDGTPLLRDFKLPEPEDRIESSYYSGVYSHALGWSILAMTLLIAAGNARKYVESHPVGSKKSKNSLSAEGETADRRD